MAITSASLRGKTTTSADLPCNCSLRIGLYQKKSRERRLTTCGSAITGASPISARKAARRSALALSSWAALNSNNLPKEGERNEAPRSAQTGGGGDQAQPPACHSRECGNPERRLGFPRMRE